MDPSNIFVLCLLMVLFLFTAAVTGLGVLSFLFIIMFLVFVAVSAKTGGTSE